MGEASAVMISLAVEEDLGLAIKSTKGGAVDNPVSIPLVGSSEGMFRFRSNTPDAFRGLLSIGSEQKFAGVGGHGKNKMMTEK
jgi:hypothetical protein